MAWPGRDSRLAVALLLPVRGMGAAMDRLQTLYQLRICDVGQVLHVR